MPSEQICVQKTPETDHDGKEDLTEVLKQRHLVQLEGAVFCQSKSLLRRWRRRWIKQKGDKIYFYKTQSDPAAFEKIAFVNILQVERFCQTEISIKTRVGKIERDIRFAALNKVEAAWWADNLRLWRMHYLHRDSFAKQCVALPRQEGKARRMSLPPEGQLAARHVDPPEYWLHVIRLDATAPNLTSLESLLCAAGDAWLARFLAADGLSALLVAFRGFSSPQRMRQGNMQQAEACIACIRSLLLNKNVLEAAVTCSNDKALRLLPDAISWPSSPPSSLPPSPLPATLTPALPLTTPGAAAGGIGMDVDGAATGSHYVQLATLLVQFLTTLVLYSPDGHRRCMHCLDELCMSGRERFRMAPLTRALSSATHTELQCSLLSAIAMLVNATRDANVQRALVDELLALHLPDILQRTRVELQMGHSKAEAGGATMVDLALDLMAALNTTIASASATH